LVFRASVWYDDWTPNGGAQLIAGWGGEWDGKGVQVEIDLLSRNWGDAYPGISDIVQKKDHPNFQWVEMSGKAMGLAIPRQQETRITIHWHTILANLIARGLLKGPKAGLAAARTKALSIATEVRNGGSSKAAVAEARITDFRVSEAMSRRMLIIAAAVSSASA